MSSPARRLGLLSLVFALGALLLPAATLAADTSSTAVSAAESRALTLINAERTERGLVALRLDSRLEKIAGARASYMASTGVFSHTEKDGDNVFDRIEAADITWYGAGEIIAWNTVSDLDGSADYAAQAWMNSSGHKAIIISKDYNYVAFGLAVASNGRRYWAGVFMKGPDRTGAWAKVADVSKSRVSSSYSKVTISWGGADTKLQVLTAGLRDFQFQRRRDGGSWVDSGTTTATSYTKNWWVGHVYELRVRARDKNGNWGGWKYVTVKP
ncbi:MAG TPA: CAP domain-containing protein [Candidatus Saccharimonadales bacterium]|nr:CAP domain-containing protein [Candidatus Saccharimonadales bacterium]